MLVVWVVIVGCVYLMVGILNLLLRLYAWDEEWPVGVGIMFFYVYAWPFTFTSPYEAYSRAAHRRRTGR